MGSARRSATRAAAAAFAFAAAAAFAQVDSSGLSESVIHASVVSQGREDVIQVTVYRPDGPGPFPIVVLSHGSPRSAEERRRAGRQRLVAQSRVFLSMGYAVLVPTRRGYGESGGDWAEAYGPCSDPDYHRAGLESARDLRAAVDSVRREPWADTARVVLAGQSAGGWASIAASSVAFPGLVAVVNFAGGRGSRGPNDVCGESRLVEAVERYGRRSRVPTLWVYSENDLFFGPELARRMHRAFVQAGGRAEFLAAPANGADGHGYFARAMGDWSGHVGDFLQRVGAAPARE